VKVQLDNIWRSKPLVAIGCVGQLCLLIALSWLSSDHQAHHRVHHLAESICKICGHHTDYAPSETDHHPTSGDEDCGITMFANGHANASTVPVSVEVPAPAILFLNGTPVVPVLPPSPRLLPFSCGPPTTVA